MSQLAALLEKGVSPFHTVEWCKGQLKAAGFHELDIRDKFTLRQGGKYYVVPYGSTIVSFVVGSHFVQACKTGEARVKMAMAHTDSPCFKVKAKPEYVTKQYMQVNVEPYGGMLKKTWFDRPLGLAGKVVLASEDIYQPKVCLFDSKEAVLTIPSLAPHLNRDANKKSEYDMQTELQPIVGMLKEQCEKDDFLIQYIANRLKCKTEDILSFDLYLYNMELPQLVGIKQEFLSAPRIDNLASVAAFMETMPQVDSANDLVITACYDNEEIGSRSKQGADSELMRMLMTRIYRTLNLGQYLEETILRGYLLSVDGAHGVHPNYVLTSDPTNPVFLGSGPAIKVSASQRYLSDSEGMAVIMQLCKKNDVPYQIQENRSGMPGGQTLGPIAASYFPMQGADVGIPMLAMHSARELMVMSDYWELIKLLKGLFQ